MIRIVESDEMTIKEFCQELENIYYQKFPNSACITRFFDGNKSGFGAYPGIFVGGILASKSEYDNAFSNHFRLYRNKDTHLGNAISDIFDLSFRFDFFTYSGDNAVYWTYDDPYEQTNEQFHGPTENTPMPSKFEMSANYCAIACKEPGITNYKGDTLNGMKKIRFKDDQIVDVSQALKLWSDVVNKFYKTVSELHRTGNIPEDAYKYCDIASKL